VRSTIKKKFFSINNKKIISSQTLSDLISLTAIGLESEGLQIHAMQHHAAKMARAATSTYRGSGVGS
jgi:hypothetical protein